jgi:hypothetical protein
MIKPDPATPVDRKECNLKEQKEEGLSDHWFITLKKIDSCMFV